MPPERKPRFVSSIVKRLLYSSGLFSLYHRVRNRRSLTVAMFHRVLPENDPRWPDADLNWTVTDRLFRNCLEFFRKHYNVIGIDDLLSAGDGGESLPARPLLITFDDGWADNEQYAAGILQEYRLPAVVFVVAGAVDQEGFWRERLYRQWRRGSIDADQLDGLWRALPDSEDTKPQDWTSAAAFWALANRLDTLDDVSRPALLNTIFQPSSALDGPVMLSAAQLGALVKARIGIGSHGLTHTPIPLAANPQKELKDSRRRLVALLGLEERRVPLALSFPHGLYNEETVQLARAAGYRLLFTSDPHLASADTVNWHTTLIGRVNIPSRNITDRKGNFRPELLALWLFNRPRVFTDARRKKTARISSVASARY
ncbi:MAG: polysaccharide deacetylase family protein [Bryobacteraceae bacterium]|nr:polysaccharide deacetylase family protein [Bryobacteraceae bacterium]